MQLINYFSHFKDPSLNSIYNPINKINIINMIKINDNKLKILIKIKGKTTTISISKNKKTNKILKNWIENDTRGQKKELNPHSKEINFSFFKLPLINLIFIITTKINIISITDKK